VYTRGQQNEETMRKHSYTFITLKDHHITIAESFVYGNVLFVIDSQTEFNTPTSYEKIKTYHEDLLQLTKDELELVPNATKFEHTKNWKQEVIKYIEQRIQNRENEGVEQEINYVLDSEINTIDSGTFTPISVVEERIERWEELIDTIISVKKLPSTRSKDPKEAKLGSIISQYKSKGLRSGMTDEQESWLNARDIRPITDEEKDLKKEQRKKNWDAIIEFITTHNRLPSAISKDPKEAKLGRIFDNYKSKGQKSGMTDEQESWLNSHDIRPTTLEEKDLKKEQRKKSWDAIIEFITTHNRHPSAISKDPEEARLGSIISQYKSTGIKSGMTDEQESWLNSHDIRPTTLEEKDLKKEQMKKNWEEIIEFITTHNRHPSTMSKDTKEAKLGKIINHYKSKGIKSGMTDKQESWLNSHDIRPITDEEKDLKKEQRKKSWDATIEFITTQNRQPSAKSKDPQEARLGRNISQYKSTGLRSGMTDEQEAWLNKAGVFTKGKIEKKTSRS
jgi:hypothetical protein